MRRVIVESPYAGDIELNLRYLCACMADCLARGEAPFASHGLYTQPGVLRDDVPEEREAGILAGFAWREAADATVVYEDLGMSRGMEYGIAAALNTIDAERARNGYSTHAIDYRQLGPDWDAKHVEQRRRDDLLHIRLRAGLIEALDGWLRITNRGIPAELEQESITKIAELRKLVTP